jgi:hypothetical protein
VVVLRVLLWTVVLVAPGGFLLAPVLVLKGNESSAGGRVRGWVRATGARLQRYWTKS